MEPVHLATPLPEILFLTSYPPRECGIATYSQDLLKSLNNKFKNSFSLKVCALESGNAQLHYPKEVKYVLDTTDAAQYVALAATINSGKRIKFVLIQHEFGFFENGGEAAFLQFLYVVTKPIVLVFHTVLPNPDEMLRAKVRRIAAVCAAVVVMTKNAAQILNTDYSVYTEKTSVIPHGTHLVPHLNKNTLKEKYGLKAFPSFQIKAGCTKDTAPYPFHQAANNRLMWPIPFLCWTVFTRCLKTQVTWKN
ncbi:MAG: hypothetical protein NW218_21535 [Saprospiraceae bacterium]|nr:hypothetical protein [Saprospiraceae bacterium]